MKTRKLRRSWTRRLDVQVTETHAIRERGERARKKPRPVRGFVVSDPGSQKRTEETCHDEPLITTSDAAGGEMPAHAKATYRA